MFEEEGWAEHIHDPLPVNHDIDVPTRLHDAINRLNRCQINRRSALSRRRKRN